MELPPSLLKTLTPPNSAALEATVSGAPVPEVAAVTVAGAPGSGFVQKAVADALVGGFVEKVVDEAPGSTQAKGINAKLWHYRLGHVSER
ncbi:hypothetical protein Drorol1_Dr00024528, partial [Drosera rotundifolia]